MSAISQEDFDSVRNLLNHRADETRYPQMANAASSKIDAVTAALSRVQSRFPDIALSPYMNSAVNTRNAFRASLSTETLDTAAA